MSIAKTDLSTNIQDIKDALKDMGKRLELLRGYL